MAFWVVIVPLPLALIVPIRSGGHLYLPLFGWAMIFAKLASDLIALLCRSSLLIGQGTRVDAAAGKMSSSTFRIGATLTVALALAIFTRWKNQPSLVRVYQNVGQETSHVIEAFRSLDLTPGTREHDSGEGKPVHPRPEMGCPFHTFPNVERSLPANLAGRSKQTDTPRAGEHGLRHFIERISRRDCPCP